MCVVMKLYGGGRWEIQMRIILHGRDSCDDDDHLRKVRRSVIVNKRPNCNLRSRGEIIFDQIGVIVAKKPFPFSFKNL